MAKPELKKRWWIGIKPKTVKGVELEKALGTVEASDGEKLAAALQALTPAINKARAELKGQKDLLKDLDALESLAEGEAKKVLAELAKTKAAAAKAAEKAADKKDADDEGDDEEPSEDRLFDVELHRKTLKRALRQPLVFGFSVGSRAENRSLALGVRGNPMKFGKLAKEKGGGAKACFGRLMAAPGEANKLVLTLEGPLVPGTVKALRMFCKENKITLFKKFAVIVDGQEAEAGSDDDDETPDDGTTAAPKAAAAATAAAGEAAAPPAKPIEVLEDRRREFKKARAAWVAVKTRAEQDLEKVKDGAHMAYIADPAQFPKVVAGCKAVDEILDNLDDELRDTLDQYASTPLRSQKKLEDLAATATGILERYQRFVADNKMMRAIDEKEFADVAVHAPVTKALADLRKSLG